MTTILPAVIPKSRRHLDAMLMLFGSFTNECQVDIVDGIFDDSKSWPYNTSLALADVLLLQRFDQMRVELDLMIKNPEDTLDTWLRTGASRIIIHVESTNHLDDILAHAGTHAYQLGLAFTNDTDLSLLSTVDMSCVDFVQLMGIADIGEQGNPFDARVIPRIAFVRKAFPKLPISIDGGVTKETITTLKHAGATKFVVGSAIVRALQPALAYKELEALAKMG